MVLRCLSHGSHTHTRLGCSLMSGKRSFDQKLALQSHVQQGCTCNSVNSTHIPIYLFPQDQDHVEADIVFSRASVHSNRLITSHYHDAAKQITRRVVRSKPKRSGWRSARRKWKVPVPVPPGMPSDAGVCPLAKERGYLWHESNSFKSVKSNSSIKNQRDARCSVLRFPS